MLFYLLGVTLLTWEVTAFSNVTVEQIPDYYLNLSAGNSLWTSLIKNCQKPTMACVEKNMYDYLKDTLDYQKDFQLTSFMTFKKNQVDYDQIQKDYSNQTSDKNIDHDEDEEEEEDESRSAIEEMSRSLHDKTIKFLMTHDMEVQLPETIFEGTTLKLSPRSFEENGALIRFEFMPRQMTEIAEGRIFKKLKNFISEKLIYALMAILLIIKLLAAKFMFFMPMMVGAVTAKKLLIKVLLFLFPALHHFFKLCAYVPHGHKFHHHKHHINHIHHISRPHKHHKHHHHGHGHHHHHGGVEIIHPHADGPPILAEDLPWHGHGHGKPSLHHHVEIEPVDEKPFYNPHEQELEYYSGGPALTNHFINHRQDSSEDENEVSWGQGQPKKPMGNRPLTPTEIEQMVLKAEREAMLKTRLQQERQRIQEENARLQEQLRQAMKLQEKLRQQAAVMKAKLPQPPPPQEKIPVSPPSPFLQTPIAQPKHVYSAQKKQEPVVEKPVEKPVQKPVEDKKKKFEEALHQAASITYDPFYSPILEKIDKILVGLGFNDEPCRERLICSMYKDPVRFSPHSNLLSAELSRDSKELQKPATTNAAVIRFYRYVQAARDGQDQRECLRLYPSCSINTEQ